jgi:hypothetical protein
MLWLWLACHRAPLEVAAADRPWCGETAVVPAVSCESGPIDQGLSRRHPLEWGPRGTPDSALWTESLLCDDGATPAATFGDGEATLLCPAKAPVIVYVSDRCGSPCPPAGFRMLAPAASFHLVNARILLDGGEVPAAIKAAELAVLTAPDAEPGWRVLATALARGERPKDAALAFGQALSIHPGQLRYSVGLAVGLMLSGDAVGAEETWRKLAMETAAEDPSRGDVDCGWAVSLYATGDKEKAHLVMDAACREGAAECCPDAN